jgi:hypothetical protein
MLTHSNKAAAPNLSNGLGTVYDGKKAVIPTGASPALMRAEFAAAYVGETTVEAFLGRVGDDWPMPWRERGTGKGKYRVWRKSDLDRLIDPDLMGGDPAGW